MNAKAENDGLKTASLNSDHRPTS